MSCRILYVGPRDGTCRHRALALEQLGNRVEHLDAKPPTSGWGSKLYRVARRLRGAPDLTGLNARILAALERETFEILWVDKGLAVRPGSLRRARERRPEPALVSYSPDDMNARDLQSRSYLRCLPLYDLHVTTKSYNVEELRQMGARDVLFVDNAFDPDDHRPLELGPEERERFACEIGFVGTYERDRAHAMLELARRGLDVTVRGDAWHRFRGRHPRLHVHRGMLRGLDYARAINATAISLGFLRKAYRDLQTTRSIEIPACGGFLLAERTDEHRRLFEEGVEAEFFSSPRELLDKCRYYLEHPDKRRRIAQAGLRRCLESGYRNRDRLPRVIDHLRESGALPAG